MNFIIFGYCTFYACSPLMKLCEVISLLSGAISMKLATNIYSMCGKNWKDFQSLASKWRSRSLEIHLSSSSFSTAVSISVCVQMCMLCGWGTHCDSVASVSLGITIVNSIVKPWIYTAPNSAWPCVFCAWWPTHLLYSQCQRIQMASGRDTCTKPSYSLMSKPVTLLVQNRKLRQQTGPDREGHVTA